MTIFEFEFDFTKSFLVFINFLSILRLQQAQEIQYFNGKKK